MLCIKKKNYMEKFQRTTKISSSDAFILGYFISFFLSINTRGLGRLKCAYEIRKYPKLMFLKNVGCMIGKLRTRVAKFFFYMHILRGSQDCEDILKYN